MSTRAFTRPELEALVIARVLAYGDAERMLDAMGRAVFSPAAVVLLLRMLPGADADGPMTKGQRALADRVRAVTVFDMLRLSREELIARVNALPDRPRREPAWTRDLAAAGDSAA